MSQECECLSQDSPEHVTEAGLLAEDQESTA
jgi:hypothetical protein